MERPGLSPTSRSAWAIQDEHGILIARAAAAEAGWPDRPAPHRRWKPATRRELAVALRADRQRFEREQREVRHG